MSLVQMTGVFLKIRPLFLWVITDLVRFQGISFICAPFHWQQATVYLTIIIIIKYAAY
jgi:hypothetical protein